MLVPMAEYAYFRISSYFSFTKFPVSSTVKMFASSSTLKKKPIMFNVFSLILKTAEMSPILVCVR